MGLEFLQRPIPKGWNYLFNSKGGSNRGIQELKKKKKTQTYRKQIENGIRKIYFIGNYIKFKRIKHFNRNAETGRMDKK